MNGLFALARKLARDDSGATAIEYGLIAALVSVGIIAALSLVGDGLGNVFNAVGEALTNAQQ